MALQQGKYEAKVRDFGDKTRDHAHGLLHRLKHTGPLGWLGIAAAVAVLATIAVISFVVLAPIFIFFSPILIPLGFFLFLCAAGLLIAGGAALATAAAVSWAYKYFKGRHPPGAQHVDYAMRQLHETADQAKQKARDFGGQVHGKMQDAAPGA